MANYGSDKGHPENKSRHNYTQLSNAVFSGYRTTPIRLFELGIGSNNTKIQSNMGPGGRPGASLRAWRDYFPKGSIYGADIDVFCIMTENRLKTYYCDQTNPVSIQNMWNHDPQLYDEFDILIEDGLHRFDANVCFFENSCWKLKQGGVYVIEDIEKNTVQRWETQISLWKQTYGTRYEYRLLELPPPSPQTTDNNVLLIQRIE
jgi:hypothetical protein